MIFDIMVYLRPVEPLADAIHRLLASKVPGHWYVVGQP